MQMASFQHAPLPLGQAVLLNVSRDGSSYCFRVHPEMESLFAAKKNGVVFQCSHTSDGFGYRQFSLGRSVSYQAKKSAGLMRDY